MKQQTVIEERLSFDFRKRLCQRDNEGMLLFLVKQHNQWFTCST